MTPEEKKQLDELTKWKMSLEKVSTIPLNIDQSFRQRFSSPTITKVTLNFPSTAADMSSSLTVPVAGAKLNDLVVVTPPSAAIVGNIGGIFVGYVSATGIVTIRFINPDSGTSLDPGVGVFTIAVFKQ